MLNFIVPTYVAMVFCLEASSALVSAQQAAPPVDAEEPVITLDEARPLPSLPADEEIQSQPELPVMAAPAAPVQAEPRPGPVVDSEIVLVQKTDWPQYITPAREAMSAARTARGRFTQINADNTVSGGSFALRRPGRMRFDYDTPSPILIVADGATVAISDSDLETVDRVPLSTTPLNILLDEEITFGADVEVLQILERPNSVAITVRDLTGDMDGRLTLIFAEETFDLMGWIAIDTEGQITQVSLENTETNVRVNPVLFRLDDPADEEEER